MSFVDKAYEEVLEQLKKEGTEFIFCGELCDTDNNKIIEQEDFCFPEEILEQNSIPEIINAFKKYYGRGIYHGK